VDVARKRRLGRVEALGAQQAAELRLGADRALLEQAPDGLTAAPGGSRIFIHQAR